jgi:hypothetical protein
MYNPGGPQPTFSNLFFKFLVGAISPISRTVRSPSRILLPILLPCRIHSARPRLSWPSYITRARDMHHCAHLQHLYLPPFAKSTFNMHISILTIAMRMVAST